MKSYADFNKNNLDCLRLILAFIVALFHIYALSNVPALSLFGRYLSPQFAVKGFFIISGLLIYRSYARSSTVTSYFEKRARRIYPAYFAIITAAAIALFPLSTFPTRQYWGMGLGKYLAANLVFLNFLAPSLPGIFTSNITTAVNGALWTLKIEVAFYCCVPGMHYFCSRFGPKRVMPVILGFSCVWKYGFAYLATLDYSRHGHAADNARSLYSQLQGQFPAQLAYFSAGILLLLYFDKLKHHFLAISCFAACLFLLDQWVTRNALDVFWISGFVFIFGFWRYFGNFSKYGDFSYGVYIVHWPIVQALISLGVAKAAPAIFLLASLSSICLAAFLMWNLVENRFLASSSHYRQVSQMRPA